MWLGVILYGVAAMGAAGLSDSGRTFETEEACSAWVDETIDSYRLINSTKDPAHQVMAAGFCVIAPTRRS